MKNVNLLLLTALLVGIEAPAYAQGNDIWAAFNELLPTEDSVVFVTLLDVEGDVYHQRAVDADCLNQVDAGDLVCLGQGGLLADHYTLYPAEMDWYGCKKYKLVGVSAGQESTYRVLDPAQTNGATMTLVLPAPLVGVDSPISLRVEMTSWGEVVSWPGKSILRGLGQVYRVNIGVPCQ